MHWLQRRVTLQARPRGFHLVTGEIVGALPELEQLAVGVVHLFIQHTSASLTLNENASPEVMADLESWSRNAVPDDTSYFRHTAEGPDDMTAHVKASLMGAGLSIPIHDGRLALGTWQGIVLCEHRENGGPRSLIATCWGVSQSGNGSPT